MKPADFFERNQIFLLTLLFCASLVIRAITAQYIENGGDCVGLWLNIRSLLEGLGFNAWNHHTMRWAITMPLALITKIMGTAPWVYYILPIAYSSVSTVLVALIGKHLHSFKLGVFCALLFMLYPQMAQTGSQIWPGVFELTYILASVLCLLAWLDSKSSRWLVGGAILFVCAWGSRVTSVYFFPGLLCLIWIPTREIRPVLKFCVFVALLLFLEWLFFFAVSGSPLGRIGLIKASHVAQDELLITTKEYLLNFLNYKKLRGLLIIFILAISAAVSATTKGNSKIKAIAWLFLLHTVLMTWMISSLSPLKVAMPIGSRYGCSAIPYGLLLIGIWLFHFATRKPKAAKNLTTLFTVAFLVFSILKIPANNSIIQTYRDGPILSEALRTQTPIYMKYTPWEPNIVEKWAIETFGGKKRQRSLDSKKVNRFMRKNRNRIINIFTPDIADIPAINREAMIQVSKYVYLFNSPERSDTPQGEHVLVEYGRKKFMATETTSE